MTNIQPGHDGHTISDQDRILARSSRARLEKYLAPVPESVRLQIADPGKPVDSVELPSSALYLLSRILDEMADGHNVSVVPQRAEISTQKAADYLNVSRPYVVGLIDTGEIPSRKVGNRRRVLFTDVEAFRQRSDTARLEALAELSAQAQELNMGY